MTKPGEMPNDKVKIPWEQADSTKAPPEDKRAAKVVAMLVKRGSAYSSGLRIMNETGMKSDELFPVLDKLIGENKVRVIEMGEGPARRQMFRAV